MSIWLQAFEEWSASPNDSRRSGRDEAQPVMDYMRMLHLQMKLLTPCRYDTLLDLGCGNGLFALPLSRLANKIICVDPVARQLEHAAAVIKPLVMDARFVQGTAEDLSFLREAEVNKILMNGVMQCVDPAKLLATVEGLFRVTARRGRVLLQGVPEGKKLWPIMKIKHDESIQSGNAQKQMLLKAVVMYDREMLAAVFRCAGFYPELIEPQPGDPHRAEGFHLLAKKP